MYKFPPYCQGVWASYLSCEYSLIYSLPALTPLYFDRALNIGQSALKAARVKCASIPPSTCCIISPIWFNSDTASLWMASGMLHPALWLHYKDQLNSLNIARRKIRRRLLTYPLTRRFFPEYPDFAPRRAMETACAGPTMQAAVKTAYDSGYKAWAPPLPSLSKENSLRILNKLAIISGNTAILWETASVPSPYSSISVTSRYKQGNIIGLPTQIRWGGVVFGFGPGLGCCGGYYRYCR